MPEYYVNRLAQSSGDHDVHRADYCPTPADLENREPFGYFPSCHGAVAKAKERYPTADGCANCCPECHTR